MPTVISGPRALVLMVMMESSVCHFHPLISGSAASAGPTTGTGASIVPIRRQGARPWQQVDEGEGDAKNKVRGCDRARIGWLSEARNRRASRQMTCGDAPSSQHLTIPVGQEPSAASCLGSRWQQCILRWPLCFGGTRCRRRQVSASPSARSSPSEANAGFNDPRQNSKPPFGTQHHLGPSAWDDCTLCAL